MTDNESPKTTDDQKEIQYLREEIKRLQKEIEKLKGVTHP